MEQIKRRDFIKTLGLSSLALSAAAVGCSPSKSTNTDTNAVGTPRHADPSQMTRRQFPQLDNDSPSLIGYGCMRFPTLPQPAEDGNVCDQEKVNELISYAMEHGINYYDTSPAYMQGWSERTLGEALKNYPRDSYYLATKASNFNNSDLDASIQMYENSFKYLRTDYIDYYFLHSIGSLGARSMQNRYIDNGFLDFLLKEREKGRIRHLGFSFHGVKEEFDKFLLMHDEVHWDFIMIQLNYYDWKYGNLNAEYMYTEIAKLNIPMAVMEPMLGGRLANLPIHIVERLKQRRPESSIASWAFRYAGSYPLIYTVLSGMGRLDHVIDNAHTYAPLEPVTEEETQFLHETATLMRKYPTIPCNDCKYCMPCPYGIDIPANLLFYNKCVNDGSVPVSRKDPNYAAQRRAYLIGLNRTVEKERQQDHCIGCNHCIPECPQGINIPRELHKLSKFIEELKQDTFDIE